MKILDLINASAVKAGIPSDNEDLKKFLSTPLTPESVVPENIAKAINGLMNLEAAKNNPVIEQHFKAVNLNPLDAKFNEIALSLELDSSDLEALKAEKSTYAKPDLLREKLAAKMAKLKEAKKEGESEGKIKTLQTEIDLLRTSIKDKDALVLQAQKQAQDTINEYIERQELLAQQNSFTWSDLYSKDVQDILFKTKMEAKLAEKKAKIAVVDGKVKLVRADNPAMDYYDDKQNLVPLSQFAAEVMNENKFIKVAEKPNTQTIVGTPVLSKEAPNTNTSKIPSVAARQLAELDAELGINP